MNASLPKPDELTDLKIEMLGKAAVTSPMADNGCRFIEDDEKIFVYSHSKDIEHLNQNKIEPPAFERAGPRKQIYFEPKKLNCGIVTCGGLCPGINDVIRSVVLCLSWQYDVNKIYGFRYGYAGLSENPPEPPIILTPFTVDNIHLRGGNILSSSRGPQDEAQMVKALCALDIGILFVVGGDGTLRGASDLADQIKKENKNIAIIGIPKTIDNDIYAIERSFGFSTAIGESRSAILTAHSEAKGAYNGLGLVKLMGRDSGFIAASATLANSDVNFCFIPEQPLVLDGDNGLLSKLEKRFEKKHHAVIVVAEGAGRQLTESPESQRDESGNIIRKDIGLALKKIINNHFKKINVPVAIKYIDPSYIIRGMPADSNDSAFCLMLAQNAVHAGISGRTNMVIGYWNQYFVNIPISLATLKRKKLDPDADLWQSVMQIT